MRQETACFYKEGRVAFQVDDARDFLAGGGLDVEKGAAQIDGTLMSALVRAEK